MFLDAGTNKPVPTLRSTVSAKVSMICLIAHMTGAKPYSLSKSGAMSWAFLEAMRSHGNPTYKEVSYGRHRSLGLTDTM
jgi:hypothetical protein